MLGRWNLVTIVVEGQMCQEPPRPEDIGTGGFDYQARSRLQPDLLELELIGQLNGHWSRHARQLGDKALAIAGGNGYGRTPAE